MLEKFQQKFNELIDEGSLLVIKFSETQGIQYINPKERHVFYSWFMSSANLIANVTANRGAFFEESVKLRNEKFDVDCVKEMFGILLATKREWDSGTLKEIEYIVIGETFDNFLDHAKKYHRGGMVTESGIAVSIVFEDALKKIAKKKNINESKVEEIINEMQKQSLITSSYAKRLKGYADIRNNALHADWSKLNIAEIGDMINGTKTLIETHL